jgi:hypothetical protein
VLFGDSVAFNCVVLQLLTCPHGRTTASYLRVQWAQALNIENNVFLYSGLVVGREILEFQEAIFFTTPGVRFDVESIRYI